MGSMQEKGVKMGERTKRTQRDASTRWAGSIIRYESIQGRPYDRFTPQGIATMSLACSLLAVVSLLLGA